MSAQAPKNPTPAIGPALAATIVSKHFEKSINAWCIHLGQYVYSEDRISAQAAGYWGYPELAQQRVTWLANELDEPWLRIIDSPASPERKPFTSYGWLSLEISVENVDQLFEDLKASPFEIIGEPANLDVSDNIRAMQVIGLDGEVLYLTEVKAEVPPFELPFARCYVDRLFIPVGLVENRNEALKIYESHANTKGLQFDTKITVINRALGHKIGKRHPVATVQLAGKTLVELDQIEGLNKANTEGPLPQAGISSISFEVESFPQNSQAYKLANGPQAGRNSVSVRGPSGELLELIDKA